jgi:predicted transglutaminase-like cysteine proteinase
METAMFAELIISQALPYSFIEACATKPNMRCERPITLQGVIDMHGVITEGIKTRDNPDPYDAWTPFPRDPDGRIFGDCDDQAASERAALIAFGMDPSKLAFESGKVKEPDGREVGHVVLVVELDGKRYVLDRRYPQGVYPADGKRPNWTTTAMESHSQITWATD